MNKRKLRALPMSTIRFIHDWIECLDAGLSFDAFCEIHDMPKNTAYGQRHRLFKRGINLPYLTGMRARPNFAGICEDTDLVVEPETKPCTYESFVTYC